MQNDIPPEGHPVKRTKWQTVEMAKGRRDKTLTRRQGELMPISDVLSESKIMVVANRQISKLLEAAADIYRDPGDADNAAWMAQQLVQATLPHREPKGEPPEWYRKNGDLTLSIRPGYSTDEVTGERYCIGYPFGAIPRLLLFWVITEAVKERDRRIRENDRRIYLGRSLAEFMRKVGLNPNNGTGPRSDATRLREQMERLFNAQISFDQVRQSGKRWLHMSIAPQGELWWDAKQPEQGHLWQSWIELGEQFFHAITASPVPVDIRALKELKQSPLALDLYAWATYKTFVVSRKGIPQQVPWKQLEAQLGGEYANPKDFKRKAKAALKKVGAVYPWLKVEQVDGGIIVHPSRPAISEKLPDI